MDSHNKLSPLIFRLPEPPPVAKPDVPKREGHPLPACPQACSPRRNPHSLKSSSASRSHFIRVLHGGYDCLYVALDERESCDLVAADARRLSNLKLTFRFVRFC